MSVSKARLSVYFEGPFWVGLYRREDGDGCRVCKVTFGAEPRDQEVLDYLQRHWRELSFSPLAEGEREPDRSPNPKRARREARRAVRPTGAGTWAQQPDAQKTQPREGGMGVGAKPRPTQKRGKKKRSREKKKKR